MEIIVTFYSPSAMHRYSVTLISIYYYYDKKILQMKIYRRIWWSLYIRVLDYAFEFTLFYSFTRWSIMRTSPTPANSHHACPLHTSALQHHVMVDRHGSQQKCVHPCTTDTYIHIYSQIG